MSEDRSGFEGWAILELMGHRRLGGYVSEETVAGGAFVRIDVPGSLHTEPTGEQEERGGATQFYSPSAVYCITPTTEDTARRVADLGRPRPVEQWELPRALETPERDADEGPDW